VDRRNLPRRSELDDASVRSCILLPGSRRYLKKDISEYPSQPCYWRIKMPRLKSLFLVYAALALTVTASPMLAATYVVGTCKPKLPSFSSIQAAVNSAPSGTTVQICPGTYAEQITIPAPLTLVGISNGNSDEVVITVPTSGLTSVPGAFGETLFALLTANSGLAGPVNISNLTLDGTGNGVVCPPGWMVGILYTSDTSGVVNEVTARNLQTSGSCGNGVGAWFENGDGSNSTSVTLENSSFHDIQDSSLITAGNMLVTVKGNFMQANAFDVQWFANSGSMTGNYISSGTCCSSNIYAPITLSGNTFVNSTYALETFGDGTVVTGNKFFNVGMAIQEDGNGDTYKSNTIIKANIGIEFYCNSPALVAGNTINDATTGLDQVPSGFSGANQFDSVTTVRTGGCTSASVKSMRVKAGRPQAAPLDQR
jgi:hypothetical protein